MGGVRPTFTANSDNEDGKNTYYIPEGLSKEDEKSSRTRFRKPEGMFPNFNTWLIYSNTFVFDRLGGFSCNGRIGFP